MDFTCNFELNRFFSFSIVSYPKLICSIINRYRITGSTKMYQQYFSPVIFVFVSSRRSSFIFASLRSTRFSPRHTVSFCPACLLDNNVCFSMSRKFSGVPLCLSYESGKIHSISHIRHCRYKHREWDARWLVVWKGCFGKKKIRAPRWQTLSARRKETIYMLLDRQYWAQTPLTLTARAQPFSLSQKQLMLVKRNPWFTARWRYGVEITIVGV